MKSERRPNSGVRGAFRRRVTRSLHLIRTITSTPEFHFDGKPPLAGSPLRAGAGTVIVPGIPPPKASAGAASISGAASCCPFSFGRDASLGTPSSAIPSVSASCQRRQGRASPVPGAPPSGSLYIIPWESVYDIQRRLSGALRQSRMGIPDRQGALDRGGPSLPGDCGGDRGAFERLAL